MWGRKESQICTLVKLEDIEKNIRGKMAEFTQLSENGILSSIPTFGSLKALFLIKEQPEPAVAILNHLPQNIHFTYHAALLLTNIKSAAFLSFPSKKSQKRKREMERTFCCFQIPLDLYF